jgi:hypothetical protein
MSRNSLSEHLLYLSVLLLPLSYGTKDWFSLDVRWIPPSLFLALLSALLHPKLGKSDFGASLLAILVCWALATSLSAALFWPPEAADLTALYRVVRYPALLALCAVLFLRTRVSFSSSLLGSRALLLSLSAAVSLELILAVYLVLAASSAHAVPLAELGRSRCEAQTLRVGDISLCRLTGTYTEGPQFGMCMLVSLVMLSVASTGIYGRTRWTRCFLRTGLILSAAGVFASFSDQIYIGAAAFLLAVAAFALRKRQPVLALAALVTFAVAGAFLRTSLSWKWSQGDWAADGASALGSSFGERLFHARFASTELAGTPYRFLFGVGQGRYGEWLFVVEPAFPDTTSPQSTLVAWLAEYGITGAVGWILFLGWVLLRSWRAYGILGFGAAVSLIAANMFQAQWVSEAWFLGLAFLTASSPTPSTSGSRDCPHGRGLEGRVA